MATQPAFKGCDLFVVTPIELNASNIVTTDAEVEDNIGEWVIGATYSKGQPAILGSSLWVSKEDGNTGNKPYIGSGTSNLAWDSSVVRQVYVPYRYPTGTYQAGDYVNGHPTYDLGSYGYQYQSKTGVNSSLPTGTDSNTDWQYIGPRTSYAYTRTDVESGGVAGERFWDSVQQLGFITVTAFAADPTNYFPMVNKDDRIQITEASKWTEARKLNPYLVYDSTPSTQTERLGELNYRLKITEVFTDVILKNIDATTVTVTIYDEMLNEVYSKVTSMRRRHSSPITLLYNYSDSESELFFKELPIYFNAFIDIKLEGVDGTSLVKLGGIYIGTAYSLGKVAFTPRRGSYVYTTASDTDYVAETYTRIFSHKIDFAEFPVVATQVQHDTIVNRLDKVVSAEAVNRPSIFMGMRDTLVTFNILGNITRYSQGFGASGTENTIKIEGIV